MKKTVLLSFLSCIIIVIGINKAISQTVNNGSFDGTTTGWTKPNVANTSCSATAAGEVNNTAACYGATGTCTNYGSCGSGCVDDYVAEVDNGNSPGICQSISGFTSGANAASTPDLYINLSRRVQGGTLTPSTVGVIVCLTDPGNAANTVCNTFTRSDATWTGFTTVQWDFATPTITGAPGNTSLILTIKPVTSYYIEGANGDATATCLYDPGPGGKCSNDYGMAISYVGFTSPTPITLVDFRVVKNGSETDINWQTATEKNNNYFIVERSKNGIDFIGIETIKGAGNSQGLLSYQTTDPSPYNGMSYYRLKQVDFDGKFSYSKIIAVESDQTEVEIYPNPNEGSFKISVMNEKQPYSIELTDMEGRLVYKSRGNSDATTEINGLPKGVYVVRVIGENSMTIRKIVVI